MISRVEQGVSFASTGVQWVNLSFDGGSINSKGRNASIWYNVRLMDYTWTQLDELMGMTSKYYYTDFAPLPPENCTVFGNVTDAYGNPVETSISLWNKVTYTENSTSTNDTNSSYSINARAGIYDLNFNPNAWDYENHHEVVVLSEDEQLNREIVLLPRSSNWLWFDLQDWQFATGQNIYINISEPMLPDSNCTLDIYREYRVGDDYYGEEYQSSNNSVTDSSGEHMFVIDTTSFTNGQYVFKIRVVNDSISMVSSCELWGIQISSLSLDFDIDKNNYQLLYQSPAMTVLRYHLDLLLSA